MSAGEGQSLRVREITDCSRDNVGVQPALFKED